jgi:hypothetical protein
MAYRRSQKPDFLHKFEAFFSPPLSAKRPLMDKKHKRHLLAWTVAIGNLICWPPAGQKLCYNASHFAWKIALMAG